MAKNREKYLEYMICPKCGTKGALFGRFYKHTGRKWYFNGFIILHLTQKYSQKKRKSLKVKGLTYSQLRNKNQSITVERKKCYLGKVI